MDLAALSKIGWRIENDLVATLDARQHFNLPAKITGNGNLFHMDGVILDRCHMQSVLIVSFLVPNLRLQTKRGFSCFVGE
jgi:hypothetical protein